MNTSVKILPLGGCYEIGMNLMVFEVDDTILLVDVGVGFPDSNSFGIEVLIPDFTYLRENKKKIHGIVITHGHEDHLGAVSFLLNEINVPIYLTRFASELVRRKAHELGVETKFHIIKLFEKYNIGPFGVTFFPVEHSIPESTGLKIEVKGQTITYMSDFKIAKSKQAFCDNLKKLKLIGCDLLLADSTNIEVPGWGETEEIIIPNINEIVKNAKSKVVFTTFASNIARVQTAINIAKQNKRKIFFAGLSMHVYTEIAKRLGYLDFEEDDIDDIENLYSYPDERVFVIVTGSQGENRAILKRISMNELRMININKDDTIIFSSKVIPGNERPIRNMMNDLAIQGAQIFYEKNANIHVSGHAYKEELRFLHSFLKPKYFIPVHGEYRFMCEHAKLAIEEKIDEKNIFIIKNGQEVFFNPKTGFKKGDFHLLSPSALDFINRDFLTEEIIKERKKMGKIGVIFVVLKMNAKSKKLHGKPKIQTRGFSVGGRGVGFYKELEYYISGVFANYYVSNTGKTNLEEDIKTFLATQVRSFVNERLNFKPLVVSEVIFE